MDYQQTYGYSKLEPMYGNAFHSPKTCSIPTLRGYMRGLCVCAQWQRHLELRAYSIYKRPISARLLDLPWVFRDLLVQRSLENCLNMRGKATEGERGLGQRESSSLVGGGLERITELPSMGKASPSFDAVQPEVVAYHLLRFFLLRANRKGPPKAKNTRE